MPPWHVQENKWRSARYGLDAEIILDADANERLVTDDLADLLTRLEPRRGPPRLRRRAPFGRRDHPPRCVLPAPARGRRPHRRGPGRGRGLRRTGARPRVSGRGAWFWRLRVSLDMSEGTNENETYHDYSVDDEDQPQGDGDSLVSDRGLTEPLDEGYSPPEKWSAAEGFGNTASRGGDRRDARAADRPGGARAGPLRGGGRESENVGGEVGTARAGRLVDEDDGHRRRTRRGTWSARTSASTAPARAPRRPPSTSSRTDRAPGRDGPRLETRRASSDGGRPRSPESVSRASSAACASSSARRVAASSSRVAS